MTPEEIKEKFIADVRKRILGMALDSAKKTSKVYESEHDQELCAHEFYKGAMWFAQKIEELQYDDFSGEWIIQGMSAKKPSSEPIMVANADGCPNCGKKEYHQFRRAVTNNKVRKCIWCKTVWETAP